MKKTYQLYIPVPIRKRKELAPGYGWQELIYTVIGAGIGIGFSIFFMILGKDISYAVFSPIFTGIIATTLVIKDRTNTSVIQSIQHIIQYFREQQKYEYVYHNIFEENNEVTDGKERKG